MAATLNDVSRKFTNLFHTTVILLAMAMLFGLLGWMILGVLGLIWALVFGGILFLTTPKVTPAMVLRMYGARKLAFEEVPSLYQVTSEISKRASLDNEPQLYYVPSRVMNAFSVGTRANSVIAMSDGLIRHLSIRELAGVLAHEISHISNNDLRLHTLADMMTRITSLLSFFGQILIILYLPMIFLADAHVPLFLILLLIFAPTLSVLLQLALSRTREYAADLVAVRLTGDPAGLASALKKMDTDERKIWDIFLLPGRNDPHPSLLRTHPHTKQRIDRIMRLEGTDRRDIPDFYGNIIVPHDIPVISRAPRWHWFRPWH